MNSMIYDHTGVICWISKEWQIVSKVSSFPHPFDVCIHVQRTAVHKDQKMEFGHIDTSFHSSRVQFKKSTYLSSTFQKQIDTTKTLSNHMPLQLYVLFFLFEKFWWLQTAVMMKIVCIKKRFMRVHIVLQVWLPYSCRLSNLIIKLHLHTDFYRRKVWRNQGHNQQISKEKEGSHTDLLVAGEPC